MRGPTERRRAGGRTTDDLVPQTRGAAAIGTGVHEVAFVDPRAFVLDVGLVEDRDGVLVDARGDGGGGRDEPLAPRGEIEAHLGNVGQRCDHGVLGAERECIDPRDTITVMHDARRHHGVVVPRRT